MSFNKKRRQTIHDVLEKIVSRVDPYNLYHSFTKDI
jgi:hypothetical protein